MVDALGGELSPFQILEGFETLDGETKELLQNDKLFIDGGNCGGINLASMKAVYTQARAGNNEAMSVLFHYACHINAQVRAFAKDYIADLYEEYPRLVGELAGTMVEAYSRIKGAKSDADVLDKRSMAYVAYISAMYESRNGNTGGQYKSSIDVLDSFIRDNPNAYSKDEEGKTLIASNRLVFVEELLRYSETLERLPVEHRGVYLVGNLAEIFKDRRKDKPMVAAVHVDNHFVTLVIHREKAYIVDSYPRLKASEKVEAALKELMPGAEISSIQKDLQSATAPGDPGLPNCCGIINIELHRKLRAVDWNQKDVPLYDLLDTFADEIRALSADKKEFLNDITRLKIFNSHSIKSTIYHSDPNVKESKPEPSIREAQDMIGMLPVWFS